MKKITLKFAANSEMFPTETVEIIMTGFSCPCKTAAVPIVISVNRSVIKAIFF